MNAESFIEDYLWLVVLIIIAFTIFVAYLLNKNIDASECEEGDDDDEDEDKY
jgi:type II secretory pathway component PulF